MVKKNLLTACGVNPLIHIRQKEKIALEIAAKVASVNGPLNVSVVRFSFAVTSADAQGFISYKNNLQEYAQKNHIPIPQYTPQKADVGFTASVSVDGQMFTCLQSQREKKDAEQGAAFEALKALGFIDANDVYSAKMGNGKGEPL